MIERLRELLKIRKVTQRKLAELLGVTEGAVSQVMNGRTGLSDRNIDIICDKLNISKDWLKDGIGTMEPPEASTVTRMAQLMATMTPAQRRVMDLLLTADDDTWNRIDELIRWIQATHYGE